MTLRAGPERILALVSLFLALMSGQAEAIPFTTVDAARANANGMLDITKDFSIDTGTAMKPTTSFTFMSVMFLGRGIMQNGGPSVVVYDLTALKVEKGTALTLTGALPIGFLISDPKAGFDVLIGGTLSASGDGQTPGAGGGAGGPGGNINSQRSRDGNNATGATTGAGKTGTGVGGGAGGGGGYGGAGGNGAMGGVGRGNRKGGSGGEAYGDAKLKPLFGGGGGAGSSVPVGEGNAKGGGGGGGLLISTEGKVMVTGRIEAEGAPGSNVNPGPGLGGGGGAGGSIFLEALGGVCQADSIVIPGRVSVRGGRGGADNVIASAGGGGGGGRVFLSDCFADLSRVDVRGGPGGFFGKDEDPQGAPGMKGTVETLPKPVPVPWTLWLLIGGIVALRVCRYASAGPDGSMN